MNEDTENHTLRLLREMRAEQGEFRRYVEGRFSQLETGQQKLEAGQHKLEAGQHNLEAGQRETNQTLFRRAD